MKYLGFYGRKSCGLCLCLNCAKKFRKNAMALHSKHKRFFILIILIKCLTNKKTLLGGMQCRFADKIMAV
jgi:hypothetical protein